VKENGGGPDCISEQTLSATTDEELPDACCAYAQLGSYDRLLHRILKICASSQAVGFRQVQVNWFPDPLISA
jgi:hypothetical protein